MSRAGGLHAEACSVFVPLSILCARPARVHLCAPVHTAAEAGSKLAARSPPCWLLQSLGSSMPVKSPAPNASQTACCRCTGANKLFKRKPWRGMEAAQHNRDRTAEQTTARVARALKRDKVRRAAKCPEPEMDVTAGCGHHPAYTCMQHMATGPIEHARRLDSLQVWAEVSVCAALSYVRV